MTIWALIGSSTLVLRTTLPTNWANNTHDDGLMLRTILNTLTGLWSNPSSNLPIMTSVRILPFLKRLTMLHLLPPSYTSQWLGYKLLYKLQNFSAELRSFLVCAMTIPWCFTLLSSWSWQLRNISMWWIIDYKLTDNI